MKYAALVLIGLLFPQLMGYAAYKFTKQKNNIIKATTLLIAPLCFFLVAYLYWGNQANAIRDNGNYVCGAFGAAAVFSTLYGTGIHLILAVIVFFTSRYLWGRNKSLSMKSNTC